MDATKATLLWHWNDAPDELRALSTHGGDEEFVAFVPNGVDGRTLRDVVMQHYDVEEIGHDDGTLLIAAH